MHQADLSIENKHGAIAYQGNHQAPSCWKEMELSHLYLWAAVMTTSQPVEKARERLAVLFYQIDPELVRTFRGTALHDLGNTMKWLFKRNLLDNWLIPNFRRRLRRYHGPKKRLANLTVKEYMLTELCYEQYANTKNTEFLDTLASILFRPRRYWGIDTDIRQDLTTYGYVKRAKRFVKLPARLKYAIYLNYEGCRNWIMDNNRDVFVSAGASSGKKPVKVTTPWGKIVESAAGGKFGNMKETKESNLHEFLSELGARIRECRELEKKSNQT